MDTPKTRPPSSSDARTRLMGQRRSRHVGGEFHRRDTRHRVFGRATLTTKLAHECSRHSQHCASSVSKPCFQIWNPLNTVLPLRRTPPRLGRGFVGKEEASSELLSVQEDPVKRATATCLYSSWHPTRPSKSSQRALYVLEGCHSSSSANLRCPPPLFPLD